MYQNFEQSLQAVPVSSAIDRSEKILRRGWGGKFLRVVRGLAFTRALASMGWGWAPLRITDLKTQELPPTGNPGAHTDTRTDFKSNCEPHAS